QKPVAPPRVDRRPVQFVKGKLIGVDCSNPPSAILTVLNGKKVVQFRTPDYHSLVLVGAEQFSCDWKDKNVSVNYKGSGAVEDLVSLEVH
ncbi:MAG: hypothetical protein H0X25_20245, partial [Acidobacteriales bacterium]|nr:hypothetical protein [Terriglobales bacterium]